MIREFLKFKNIYLFLVILYSGGAITFMKENYFIYIFFLITFIIQIIYSLSVQHIFKKFIVVFIVYFILSTLMMQSFHPVFFLKFISLFLAANNLTSIFKTKLIFVYEKIIYALAIISLFFFFVEFLNRNFFISLSQLIDFNSGKSMNFIIYNSHFRSEFLLRNSGFAWEPGPFSAFVAISFFIYYVTETRLKLLKIIIYSLVIITTQSELGISILLILLLYYVFSSQNINKFLKYISTITVVLMLFFTNAVVELDRKYNSEIVQYNSYSKNNLMGLIRSNNPENTITGYGRLVSIMVAYENFKNNPILGYAGNKEEKFRYIHNLKNVNFTTGVDGVIGQFGIFGIIIFIFLLINSSNYFQYISQRKTVRWVWVSIVLITVFSLGIITTPILFTFFCFNKKNKKLIY